MTTAPWALSIGMLVSFTASAGQNFGPSGLPSSQIGRIAPGPVSELAEGPSMLVAASAFRLPGLALSSAIIRTRLSFEDPERRIVVDPRQPREDMKRAADGFPQVNRTAKGDMLPSLRPGLSGHPSIELEQVVFGDTQPKLISGGFLSDIARNGEVDGPPTGFEPYAIDEGLTDPALSDSSPVSLKPKIISARQAELHLESIDGSSPLVPAASQRSSSTPSSRIAMAETTPAAFSGHVARAGEGRIALASAPASRDLRLALPGERQIYTG